MKSNQRRGVRARNSALVLGAALVLALSAAGCEGGEESVGGWDDYIAIDNPAPIAKVFPGVIIVSWPEVKDAASYDVIRTDTVTGEKKNLMEAKRDLHVIDRVSLSNPLFDGRTYEYTVISSVNQSYSGRVIHYTDSNEVILDGMGTVKAKANIPAREASPVTVPAVESIVVEKDLYGDYIEVIWTDKDPAAPNYSGYTVTYYYGQDGIFSTKTTSSSPSVDGDGTYAGSAVHYYRFPLYGGPVSFTVDAGWADQYYPVTRVTTEAETFAPSLWSNVGTVKAETTYNLATAYSAGTYSNSDVAKDTLNDGEVFLYWEKVAGATGYKVYRLENSATEKTAQATWTAITAEQSSYDDNSAPSAPKSYQYVIDSAEAGKIYIYYVVAIGPEDARSASPSSATVTVPYHNGLSINPPSGTVSKYDPSTGTLTVKLPENQRSLYWAKVTEAAGYKVYRTVRVTGSDNAIADGETLSWTELSDTQNTYTKPDGSVYYYIINTVEIGKKYQYKLIATGANGAASTPWVSSVETIAGDNTFTAPADYKVTVTDPVTGKVTIEWTVADGQTYKLDRTTLSPNPANGNALELEGEYTNVPVKAEQLIYNHQTVIDTVAWRNAYRYKLTITKNGITNPVTYTRDITEAPFNPVAMGTGEIGFSAETSKTNLYAIDLTVTASTEYYSDLGAVIYRAAYKADTEATEWVNVNSEESWPSSLEFSEVGGATLVMVDKGLDPYKKYVYRVEIFSGTKELKTDALPQSNKAPSYAGSAFTSVGTPSALLTNSFTMGLTPPTGSKQVYYYRVGETNLEKAKVVFSALEIYKSPVFNSATTAYSFDALFAGTAGNKEDFDFTLLLAAGSIKATGENSLKVETFDVPAYSLYFVVDTQNLEIPQASSGQKNKYGLAVKSTSVVTSTGKPVYININHGESRDDSGTATWN